MILTASNINAKPLMDWTIGERQSSVMLTEGLLPAQSSNDLSSASKISISVPALNERQSVVSKPAPIKGAKEKLQDKEKQLQNAYHFIQNLKQVNSLQMMNQLIQEFEEDYQYASITQPIPDLKLNTSLKRISELEQEKQQMEVVMLDNANTIESLEKRLKEARELIEFSDHDRQEMQEVAQDQQEMIESLTRQLEGLQVEFQEYREVLGRRRVPRLGKEIIGVLQSAELSEAAMREVELYLEFMTTNEGLENKYRK
jgi:hypothetical protein